MEIAERIQVLGGLLFELSRSARDPANQGNTTEADIHFLQAQQAELAVQLANILFGESHLEDSVVTGEMDHTEDISDTHTHKSTNGSLQEQVTYLIDSS